LHNWHTDRVWAKFRDSQRKTAGGLAISEKSDDIQTDTIIYTTKPAAELNSTAKTTKKYNAFM